MYNYVESERNICVIILLPRPRSSFMIKLRRLKITIIIITIVIIITVIIGIYTTMGLGETAGLSKEACLYTGADWLSSSVRQRVAKGQFAMCQVRINKSC